MTAITSKNSYSVDNLNPTEPNENRFFDDKIIKRAKKVEIIRKLVKNVDKFNFDNIQTKQYSERDAFKYTVFMENLSNLDLSTEEKKEVEKAKERYEIFVVAALKLDSRNLFESTITQMAKNFYSKNEIAKAMKKRDDASIKAEDTKEVSTLESSSSKKILTRKDLVAQVFADIREDYVGAEILGEFSQVEEPIFNILTSLSLGKFLKPKKRRLMILNVKKKDFWLM